MRGLESLSAFEAAWDNDEIARRDFCSWPFDISSNSGYEQDAIPGVVHFDVQC